jgi:hypothetical protein
VAFPFGVTGGEKAAGAKSFKTAAEAFQLAADSVPDQVIRAKEEHLDKVVGALLCRSRIGHGHAGLGSTRG